MYRVISRPSRRLARLISSAKAQAWIFGILAAIGTFNLEGSHGMAFTGYAIMAIMGSLVSFREFLRAREGY